MPQFRTAITTQVWADFQEIRDALEERYTSHEGFYVDPWGNERCPPLDRALEKLQALESAFSKSSVWEPHGPALAPRGFLKEFFAPCVEPLAPRS